MRLISRFSVNPIQTVLSLVPSNFKKKIFLGRMPFLLLGLDFTPGYPFGL